VWPSPSVGLPTEGRARPKGFNTAVPYSAELWNILGSVLLSCRTPSQLWHALVLPAETGRWTETSETVAVKACAATGRGIRQKPLVPFPGQGWARPGVGQLL
jgi:hypothetical protein